MELVLAYMDNDTSGYGVLGAFLLVGVLILIVRYLDGRR